MLYVFVGTDREKARAALNAAVAKVSKKGTQIVRIADSNTLDDLDMALRGRGMFDAQRVTVLDGIFGNEEMHSVFEGAIERLADAEEKYFVLEEKPDAAARKLLEKHAEEVKKFDAAKKSQEDNFFAFTNALRAGKKKELWVLLQKEYAAGKAPEMLHGSLFWAAKQMVLKPRASADASRGKQLVALLAALPHEARRRGEELEYALERFVLSSL